MRKIIIGVSLLGLVLTAGWTVHAVMAESTSKAAESQHWFIIESKHTGPECLKALDDMNAKAVLSKSYFGCKVGDHRAWSILQAPNSEAALNMIPESQRVEAQVAQVGKFTTADLKTFHEAKKS